MMLYLIEPKDPEDKFMESYDVYSSAIVAAETPQDAKKIHPAGDGIWNNETWVDSDNDVKAKLIGSAKPKIKRGVILASFNAG